MNGISIVLLFVMVACGVGIAVTGSPNFDGMILGAIIWAVYDHLRDWLMERPRQ